MDTERQKKNPIMCNLLLLMEMESTFLMESALFNGNGIYFLMENFSTPPRRKELQPHWVFLVRDYL